MKDANPFMPKKLNQTISTISTKLATKKIVLCAVDQSALVIVAPRSSGRFKIAAPNKLQVTPNWPQKRTFEFMPVKPAKTLEMSCLLRPLEINLCCWGRM